MSRGARLGEPHCAYCCKPEREVGKLSCRHICTSCAAEAIQANAVQIATKSGPYAQRRLTGIMRRARREAETAVVSA